MKLKFTVIKDKEKKKTNSPQMNKNKRYIFIFGLSFLQIKINQQKSYSLSKIIFK